MLMNITLSTVSKLYISFLKLLNITLDYRV